MIDAHVMTDPAAIHTFVTAGNSYFTLRSGKTGTRYTYRVKESKDGRVHFVSTLYGPDNESSYAYLGMIKDGRFGLTAKSTTTATDPRVAAFDWAWNRISAHVLPNQLEFWHEGRCGCCGRRLTVPESIENGLGPECAKKFR